MSGYTDYKAKAAEMVDGLKEKDLSLIVIGDAETGQFQTLCNGSDVGVMQCVEIMAIRMGKNIKGADTPDNEAFYIGAQAITATFQQIAQSHQAAANEASATATEDITDVAGGNDNGSKTH